MLRTFSAVSVAALVVAGSTACATKNYVRNDIKPVNDKVDTLGRSVEETQERTRKNEGTIGDVDKKAQAAQSSADSARQAAGDADAEAKAARARANEVGTKAENEKIGLDRAEAVKRYLFEQHQIPLHRMNVISYGMEKPVASNKTREGRAQNRRVVIRVLV